MIEKKFDAVDPVALKSLAMDIQATMETEDILMIRGGHKALDRSWWKSFLAESCGFELDKRQFNFHEKIELVDWWEISYQPDKATSYAYSNTRQPFHNDNAWFSDPAELNFFIMEKQAAQGGEQTIYPLSRLIADLQSAEPGLFHDLTTVKVTIKKGDEDYFNLSEIIKLDSEPRVFWNYYRTEKSDPYIGKMCEAFFNFLEKREETASVERVRALTGDCFCFHDQKVMHGRTAFKASVPFERVVLQSMWKLPETGYLNTGANQ